MVREMYITFHGTGSSSLVSLVVVVVAPVVSSVS